MSKVSPDTMDIENLEKTLPLGRLVWQEKTVKPRWNSTLKKRAKTTTTTKNIWRVVFNTEVMWQQPLQIRGASGFWYLALAVNQQSWNSGHLGTLVYPSWQSRIIDSQRSRYSGLVAWVHVCRTKSMLSAHLGLGCLGWGTESSIRDLDTFDQEHYSLVEGLQVDWPSLLIGVDELVPGLQEPEFTWSTPSQSYWEVFNVKFKSPTSQAEAPSWISSAHFQSQATKLQVWAGCLMLNFMVRAWSSKAGCIKRKLATQQRKHALWIPFFPHTYAAPCAWHSQGWLPIRWRAHIWPDDVMSGYVFLSAQPQGILLCTWRRYGQLSCFQLFLRWCNVILMCTGFLWHSMILGHPSQSKTFLTPRSGAPLSSILCSVPEVLRGFCICTCCNDIICCGLWTGMPLPIFGQPGDCVWWGVLREELFSQSLYCSACRDVMHSLHRTSGRATIEAWQNRIFVDLGSVH